MQPLRVNITPLLILGRFGFKMPLFRSFCNLIEGSPFPVIQSFASNYSSHKLGQWDSLIHNSGMGKN